MEDENGVEIEVEGENVQFEPKNEDPAFVNDIFQSVVGFLQQYGWFILLGVLVLLYIKSKLEPKIRKMKAKAEDISYQKKYDPDTAQRRLEAMERARIRLQEEHDAKAAVYAEQQKQREEEKRKQKIEEWENLQEGKAYRSKVKVKDEPSENSSGKAKPKPKLRQTDYNPLMGGGGAGYRPARRTGGG
ncbi:selenoprotein S-like [Crassostrea virginica]|uniref:Selenoprotein S-like n=1 Tax=Crassostrea virginica TaxID=6565 RepID=A0A8B8D9T9_CRAVI|nr:selenoprotein S-like [Crassostrea virginica]